jgi:beta-glucosidase
MGDIRDDDKKIPDVGSNIHGQVKLLKAYGHSIELSKLYPEDLQTIKNISSKGIPVVTIIISGRPLIVDQELAHSEAFITAWLPGSEGQGVAEVLFGDFNFQGKLSHCWPQLSQPKMHESDESDESDKNDKSYQPLFPYGFGLNYQ